MRIRTATTPILLAAASALLWGFSVSAGTAAHAVGPLAFGTAAFLPTSDGGTEPRYTVTPDDKHYAVSNSNGTARVWESDDGLTGWHLTPGVPANQTSLSTIDVDLVSMPTGSAHPGRLIVAELDEAGLNFRISFSDDGGVNWTASDTSALGLPALVPGGGELADQDRQWLAPGPGNHVYLLFHNLASGTLSHNMYVATSTDSGTSFGAPIPTTNPSTQAYLDLQCSDSGGPSNLFVNPNDGRVFAVFGTRSSVAGGGCGASITGTFEVNVVAATRVWVATAPASGATDPTQWTQSLAVDDNLSGQIVGMQLAPAAIDSANNLYVLYPESVNAYPNYDGGAIKYKHATEADVVANPYGLVGPSNDVWSAPVIVAPSGAAGNLLPHIVAGGPGQIDMAYFAGVEIAGATPATKANWYLTAAQTIDALDANPTITTVTVQYPTPPASPQAAYAGFTASQMMGACSTNGVQNGFLCSRSTDVWGVALDNEGRFQITWPQTNNSLNQCSLCNKTWVTSQTDGPTISPADLSANVPEAPYIPALMLTAFGAAAILVRRTRRHRALS